MVSQSKELKAISGNPHNPGRPKTLVVYLKELHDDIDLG